MRNWVVRWTYFEGSAERVDDLFGIDIGVDEDMSAMLARTDGLESL